MFLVGSVKRFFPQELLFGRSRSSKVIDFGKKKLIKANYDIALHGNPISELYGTSLAIWDHTVLPATRHK